MSWGELELRQAGSGPLLQSADRVQYERNASKLENQNTSSCHSNRASTCEVNFSRNLTVTEQVTRIRGNISVMNNFSGGGETQLSPRMSSFVSSEMERSRESLP